MWNGFTLNDILYWVDSDKKIDKIREDDTINVIKLSDMNGFEI